MLYLSSYLRWRAETKHEWQLLCVLIDSNTKNIFFNFNDWFLGSSQMKLPSQRKFSVTFSNYLRMWKSNHLQQFKIFIYNVITHNRNLKGAEANLDTTFHQDSKIENFIEVCFELKKLQFYLKI